MDNNNDSSEKSENQDQIKKLRDKIFSKREFVWKLWNEEKKILCREFASNYLDFLQKAKTERERVSYFKEMAIKIGYKEFSIGEIHEYKPGDKLFCINKEKNIAFVKIGKKPIEHNLNMIGAHMDSPRLDLKLRPLYDESSTGLAMVKTHYYGGLKKYNWATIPLNLTGVVVKTSGEVVKIDIGKDPQDPVLTVPDLLIHYARKLQDKRKPFDVIKGEELNAIIGSLPMLNGEEDVKEAFKFNILKILHDKYKIVEDDFESAELTLVSAIPPRFVGLDKALIGSAGQDDGICSYTAARAIFDQENIPETTSIVFLVDKEETGSNGPTGAQSSWLEFLVNTLIPDQSLSALHKTLSNTKMISADVGSVINPNFKQVQDSKNAAIMGQGVLVEKYGGAGGKYNTNDARAEYMAYIRKILKEADVPFQIVKPGGVDQGGGGTIAKFFAQSFNCDVVDAGTGLLNMHSPYELSHIADLYSTYMAYSAFLKR